MDRTKVFFERTTVEGSIEYRHRWLLIAVADELLVEREWAAIVAGEKLGGSDFMTLRTFAERSTDLEVLSHLLAQVDAGNAKFVQRAIARLDP
ncbi:MAG: hypothetical protein AB7G13_25810 [Lautropia sp.]